MSASIVYLPRWPWDGAECTPKNIALEADEEVRHAMCHIFVLIIYMYISGMHRAVPCRALPCPKKLVNQKTPGRDENKPCQKEPCRALPEMKPCQRDRAVPCQLEQPCPDDHAVIFITGASGERQEDEGDFCNGQRKRQATTVGGRQVGASG